MTGTVPVNKDLLAGGTVPVNKELLTGRVPVNNFFLKGNLTHPTTQHRDYQGWELKRGEWRLIKVKKQVDFKIHFR